MNSQVIVSVTSGAVTVNVNTGITTAEVKEALSLAARILNENLESVGAINQGIGSNLSGASTVKNDGRQENVGKLMALNTDKLKIPQTAIVALLVYGNQTRLSMKNNIENWGKRVGENFSGGNFNRDLLKSVLVREIGKTPAGETIYGLTEKGKVEAEKIIEDLSGDKAS